MIWISTLIIISFPFLIVNHLLWAYETFDLSYSWVYASSSSLNFLHHQGVLKWKFYKHTLHHMIKYLMLYGITSSRPNFVQSLQAELHHFAIGSSLIFHLPTISIQICPSSNRLSSWKRKSKSIKSLNFPSMLFNYRPWIKKWLGTTYYKVLTLEVLPNILAIQLEDQEEFIRPLIINLSSFGQESVFKCTRRT